MAIKRWEIVDKGLPEVINGLPQQAWIYATSIINGEKKADAYEKAKLSKFKKYDINDVIATRNHKNKLKSSATRFEKQNPVVVKFIAKGQTDKAVEMELQTISENCDFSKWHKDDFLKAKGKLFHSVMHSKKKPEKWQVEVALKLLEGSEKLLGLHNKTNTNVNIEIDTSKLTGAELQIEAKKAMQQIGNLGLLDDGKKEKVAEKIEKPVIEYEG